MNNLNNFLNGSSYEIYGIFIWSLIWKGLALWRASKNDQRNWFMIMLVVNTIGILEIVYLFFLGKKKLTIEEIKGWVQKNK